MPSYTIAQSAILNSMSVNVITLLKTISEEETTQGASLFIFQNKNKQKFIHHFIITSSNHIGL